MTFVDLLEEHFKDRHPYKYELGGPRSGRHGLSLDKNAYFICADDKGNVHIKSVGWMIIGNFHDPDIIDRLDQAIKKST